MARKKKEEDTSKKIYNEKFNTLKEWYNEFLEMCPEMKQQDGECDELETYRLIFFDMLASSENISITYDKNKNTTVMPNE